MVPAVSWACIPSVCVSYFLFLSEWVQRGPETQRGDEIEMLSRNPETEIKNNKHMHVLVLYGWTQLREPQLV